MYRSVLLCAALWGLVDGDVVDPMSIPFPDVCEGKRVDVTSLTDLRRDRAVWGTEQICWRLNCDGTAVVDPRNFPTFYRYSDLRVFTQDDNGTTTELVRGPNRAVIRSTSRMTIMFAPKLTEAIIAFRLLYTCEGARVIDPLPVYVPPPPHQNCAAISPGEEYATPGLAEWQCFSVQCGGLDAVLRLYDVSLNDGETIDVYEHGRRKAEVEHSQYERMLNRLKHYTYVLKGDRSSLSFNTLHLARGRGFRFQYQCEVEKNVNATVASLDDSKYYPTSCFFAKRLRPPEAPGGLNFSADLSFLHHNCWRIDCAAGEYVVLHFHNFTQNVKQSETDFYYSLRAFNHYAGHTRFWNTTQIQSEQPEFVRYYTTPFVLKSARQGFTLEYSCQERGPDPEGSASLGALPLGFSIALPLLGVVCCFAVLCCCCWKGQRQATQRPHRNAPDYHPTPAIELSSLEVGFGPVTFPEPSHMMCPISLQLMKDPVWCGCEQSTGEGHVFERACLEAHISRTASCPLSRAPIDKMCLREHEVLRKEIAEYVAEQRAILERKHSLEMSTSNETEEGPLETSSGADSMAKLNGKAKFHDNCDDAFPEETTTAEGDDSAGDMEGCSHDSAEEIV